MGVFMKFWISIIVIVIAIAIWELLGWSRWLLFGLFVILGAVFDNNSHKVNETSNGNSQQEDTTKNQQNVDLFEKSYGRKSRQRFKK